MTQPYSFQRYLSAKKTVDNRALNRAVWEALAGRISAPLRVLEIGAGIGTMLERLLEGSLLAEGEYTGIDAEAENITAALERFPAWAEAHGFSCQPAVSGGLLVEKDGRCLEVRFETAELMDFIAQSQNGGWDLLVAHAFLDLVDIPTALPKLLTLLERGGLCYFTINFDGLTLFEPVIDPIFDEKIQTLYHATMDQRITKSQPSGDSRAGRHLFNNLRANAVEIIQAGASDWVVWPTGNPRGSPPGDPGAGFYPNVGFYPYDEAYFLHFIIDTIHSALQGHPDLDPAQLVPWITRRHEQIERGELIYIAHQLDFLGVKMT